MIPENPTLADAVDGQDHHDAGYFSPLRRKLRWQLTTKGRGEGAAP